MEANSKIVFIPASSMSNVFSYPILTAHLQHAFENAAAFSVPPRDHYSLPQLQPNAMLLLMPAWSHSKAGYIGVKIATVFPDNGLQGLPSVAASYMLLSAQTGLPLAVLDGAELTLWRTACASALAASFLARKNAKVLTMVGAGSLAPHLIRAHVSMLPSITHVLIWNRTHSRAQKLAEILGKDFSFTVEGCDDLEAAIRCADLISCATLSCSALVKGSWLKKGSHLDLVGSFKPCMMECDDAAVVCSRVFVDTSAALDESGEIVGALERGVIEENHVVGNLAELVQGRKIGRRDLEEITLFKSVGCALEDLCAAQLVYESICLK